MREESVDSHRGCHEACGLEGRVARGCGCGNVVAMEHGAGAMSYSMQLDAIRMFVDEEFHLLRDEGRHAIWKHGFSCIFLHIGPDLFAPQATDESGDNRVGYELACGCTFGQTEQIGNGLTEPRLPDEVERIDAVVGA